MTILATLQQAPARWQSLAAASARVVAVALVLATMALAARQLSGEAFGFWAICFAVMNFGMALDLGFRYGLGNRVAALTAHAQSEGEQRETFWAVFHAESLIGLIGFGFCLLVLPWFDWAGLFKIQSPELARQVHWLFPLVCGLVMLNQPLMVAATVFFARQEIVFVSFLSIVQSGLLMVVFGLALQVGGLPVIVLSFFGVYGLCGLGVTLLLVGRYGWRWRWAPWRGQRAILRSFFKPSLDFFFLSLSSMTAGVIGPLVAGAAGGLAVAGDYSLIQRMFGFLLTLHLALLAPLGPAYTTHARLGDWDWIHKKLRFCVRTIWPLLFVAGGLAIWAGHPLILRLWSGRWIGDYRLAGLFAVGVILSGLTNTYSVLLNSLGIVRMQAVMSVAMLLPLVGLPVVLGKTMGIHGVALAAAGCAVPGAIWYAAWVRSALGRRVLNA
jgi:O-antigen/teichoic acid export membrane protein